MSDPQGGSWQDNNVPFGVACAKLTPSGVQSKNASSFPRKWRSGTRTRGQGNVRGTAWAFFPSRDGAAGSLSGYWTSGSSSHSHSGSDSGASSEDVQQDQQQRQPPVNSPMSHVTENTSKGVFSIICLSGGDGAVCDPVNKGFNGSVWHAANGTIVESHLRARNVTVHFDSEDAVVPPLPDYSGSINSAGTILSWSDGTSWRRSTCKCGCIPRNDPNCECLLRIPPRSLVLAANLTMMISWQALPQAVPGRSSLAQ
jgi:hypothetical protein